MRAELAAFLPMTDTSTPAELIARARTYPLNHAARSAYLLEAIAVAVSTPPTAQASQRRTSPRSKAPAKDKTTQSCTTTDSPSDKPASS